MRLPDLQLRGDLKVLPFMEAHAHIIVLNEKETYYESISPNYREMVGRTRSLDNLGRLLTGMFYYVASGKMF
jgi:hypothetical protein